MFFSNYHKERCLYERRLQLLDLLDQFARDAFYGEEFSMSVDDPKLNFLRKEFRDVLDPVDVEEGLKKIYPEHLYKPQNN